MRSLPFILILPVIVAATRPAAADIVVGSPGATWQAFPAVLNDYRNPARAFWDQRSLDGNNVNVGNYLHGTFPPPITSPTFDPDGWGKPAPARKLPTFKLTQLPPDPETFDGDFHFSRSSTGTLTAILQGEFAGNADFNAVGWYNADNPAERHLLWAGTDSTTHNATVIFTPTQNYGFFLVGKNATFNTDSFLNTGRDVGVQHFATFASDLTPGAEKYVIGVEDLPAFTTTERLGDFQDFIFTFKATSDNSGGNQPPPPGNVPEPASLALLILGALPLLSRRRHSPPYSVGREPRLESVSFRVHP
jgi:MYXO-CTERM domain-containing protein